MAQSNQPTMTEGNRQPEISQEEIKKLAEEYSSKGVYSIKWHEHPNVDRGAYTHFIAGYSAATGNRQPLSQLQQELKEAKEKFELYKRLVTEESKKIVELQNALTQSIELIKQWKGKAIASSGKSKEIIDDIWMEYFENSPDMEVIREVLGKEVGAGL